MENLLGQSLGRYHIVERLGEGGMASVYKAFDTRLERYVALKVILHGYVSSPQFLRRFEREAKSLAQLSHPNIVKVHDYGDYNDLPYLVMEYLPGGTLKQKLGQPLPPAEAVRLLLPVARALGYAHGRGIVHRDVKPANVLISESNEPMLSDFGIAKLIGPEETQGLTGTGVGIGTPEYMAPEQGMGGKVDHRADIYALGVVFFEMLTGRTPYKADTPMAVMLKKVSEPLPSPATFMPGLPAQAERVLYKALAKDPGERYQHMDEFAAALEGLMRPEAATAVMEPAPAAKKQSRRSLLLAGGIGLLLLAVTAIVITAVLLGSRLLASGSELKTADFTVMPPAETGVLSTETPTAGVEAAEISDTPAAEPTRAIAKLPDVSSLPVSWDTALPSPRQPISYQNAMEVQELARWGRGTPNEAAIAPDGSYIAAASAGGIYLYDAATLEELQFLETDKWIYTLAFSPDGRRLVCGSDKRIVYLYQLDETTGTWSLEDNVGEDAYARITQVIFSPDGSMLALAQGKVIEIWQTEPLVQKLTFEAHDSIVSHIAFSPDNSLLATGGGADDNVRLWSSDDGSLLHTLQLESMVTDVAFSPDGEWLVSSGYDHNLHLWDPDSGNLVRAIELDKTTSAMRLDFSPDGTLLAIASLDNSVRLWQTDTWQEVFIFRGHAGKVESVDFSPDGTWLASASQDDTLRLWDIEGQQTLGMVEYRLGKVKSLALSPDGDILASAASDDTLRLWQVEAGSMLAVMQEGTQSLDCATYSPAGDMIATCTGIKDVYLWDGKGGGLLRTLEGQANKVYSLAFSPDGSLLASGDQNGTIIIWQVESGEIAYTFEQHSQTVTGLVFSPRGEMLASASRDKTACLWSMPDGRLVHTYEDHTYSLLNVAFSPDGSMVSVADSADIYLWVRGENTLLASLDEIDGTPSCQAFSDDGRLLVVGTGSGYIEIWQIADEDGLLPVSERRLLQKLSAHSGYVQSVRFSPDQSLLISGGLDSTIRIWGVLEE